MDLGWDFPLRSFAMVKAGGSVFFFFLFFVQADKWC